MYKTLSVGTIRIKSSDCRESLRLASLGGFEGLQFDIHEVADRIEGTSLDSVSSLFSEAGVRPAAFSLPIRWRGSESDWAEDLRRLPRLAKVALDLGCDRTSTWIPSYSDDREFSDNFRFHRQRFAPVAEILADYKCSLGFEYLGPATLRQGHRFEFIHTMQGMLELCASIGPNVGLLLDSWHWYTAQEDSESIRRLKPDQVVYVHVNDAPSGVPVKEQIDHQRDLPGETGVIDITGFLISLNQIGYDGPVTAEPFLEALDQLPSDEARAQRVGQSMSAIFNAAGL